MDGGSEKGGAEGKPELAFPPGTRWLLSPGQIVQSEVISSSLKLGS